MGSTKIAPGPNSNANPKPNPDPNRGEIFLGGSFPDTVLMDIGSEYDHHLSNKREVWNEYNF